MFENSGFFTTPANGVLPIEILPPMPKAPAGATCPAPLEILWTPELVEALRRLLWDYRSKPRLPMGSPFEVERATHHENAELTIAARRIRELMHAKRIPAHDLEIAEAVEKVRLAQPPRFQPKPKPENPTH